MVRSIQIPHELWEEMIENIDNRLKKGNLDKPIVFALYTKEHDHCEVIGYREITTVAVKGKYPDGDYNYTYPGVKKMDFYSLKGTGKWFSGTLVVGDGTGLDEEDKKWMVKEHLDFRIKMAVDSQGQSSYKAYFMDFPVVSLNLT